MACLIANAALPGTGSLMAGRRVGYLQLAIVFLGVLLTLVYGLRFIAWYFENRSLFDEPGQDPIAALTLLWQQLRMPLLGMALFAFGWLWAVVGTLILWLGARHGSGSGQPSATGNGMPD